MTQRNWENDIRSGSRRASKLTLNYETTSIFGADSVAFVAKKKKNLLIEQRVDTLEGSFCASFLRESMKRRQFKPFTFPNELFAL